MKKKAVKSVKVLQKPGKPEVAVALVAQEVIKLSSVFNKMKDSTFNERALVALIYESCKVKREVIIKVLNAVYTLETTFFAEDKPEAKKEV